ncbi:hypothetical protein [Mesobacterium pallidum]|uniref:hypothetical protein n=1 Tax=Mesobacterium pallidum TaxID=2872037 RepID=UPI001EE1E927|nr:hypothetical protein [Mesobacterium pallidum]
MIDRDTFLEVVAMARLAPSTHNTQPARRSLGPEGITLWADLSRRLPVGDADERDLKVSCGAALEGTVLALAAQGIGARVAPPYGGSPDSRYRAMAQVVPEGDPDPADLALAQVIAARQCNRAGFGPVGEGLMRRLTDWAAQQPHMTLVTDRAAIATLARQVDTASARIMRNRVFRAELLSWMRLSPRDPRFHKDGLNPVALNMPGAIAAVARPVLGSRIYDLLARLGLGPALSGEEKATAAACGIALMHWPEGGAMLDAGRSFYRNWLTLTAMGLTAWPAAALADDPQTRAEITRTHTLPQGEVMYNALRLGAATGAPPSRVRLDPAEVILDRA